MNILLLHMNERRGSFGDFESVRSVIVSQFRSGSTYLCNLFSQHPDIVSAYEIFIKNPRIFEKNGRIPKQWRNTEKRDQCPLDFLEDFWREHVGKRAVVFKIFPGQNDAALGHVLHDPRTRIIFLDRKNKLRQFLSYKLAIQTDQWALKNGEQKRHGAVRIDPMELLVFIHETDAFFARTREMLLQSKKAALHLDYESLVHPDNECIRAAAFEYLGVPVITSDFDYLKDVRYESHRREVFEHIGCHAHDLHIPGARKQNAEPLDQLIVNYDEVADAMKSVGYQTYLDEASMQTPSPSVTIACHAS